VTEPLNESALISVAVEEFTKSGYSVKREYSQGENQLNKFDMIAEDDFGIVGLEVFSTWEQLTKKWPETQAALVKLVSRKISRSSPRFYDSYLVLICRNPVGLKEEKAEIERDTNRVRKIIISAEDITSIGSFRRSLDQLMPLNIQSETVSATDPLEQLPKVLSNSVDEKIVGSVIEAFRNLRSPMEAIYKEIEDNES